MAQIILYPIDWGHTIYREHPISNEVWLARYWTVGEDTSEGSYQYKNYVKFDYNLIPDFTSINSVTLYVYFYSSSPGESRWYIASVTREWSFGDGGRDREAPNIVQLDSRDKTSGYDQYGRMLIDTSPDAGGERWFSIPLTYTLTPEISIRVSKGVCLYPSTSFRNWPKQPDDPVYRCYLVIDYTPANKAPNAPTPTSPSHLSWTNSGSPTVSWSFNDPDIGNYQGAWAVHIIDHTSGNVVRDTGWQVGVVNSWTIYPPLPSGTYRYRIITQDQNGAQSPWSWEPIFYVDTVAPTTTGHYIEGRARLSATNEVTGSMRLVWNFNDNMSSQSAYRIVGSNSSWEARNYDSGDVWSGNHYHDIPFSLLGEGLWYFSVATRDAAGNWGNYQGDYAIFLDRTNASISSVSPTQYFNTTSGNTYRVWAYGATDGLSGVAAVRFPTSINNGPFTWFNGVKNGATNDWYCDIPVSSEGLYQMHVYVYDNAGNSVMTHSIDTVIDRTPPTITSVQCYSYTNQANGTRRVWAYGISDTSSGIDRVMCSYKVPGQNTVNGVQCIQSGSDWYVDILLSVQGEYTISFYAVDKAGNWMAEAKTAYFFVDTLRPNDPDPTAIWGTTSAELIWNPFSDSSPSSGWKSTKLYFGEWDGNNWVGQLLYAGTDVGNVTGKVITDLTPGKRYRYTVVYQDNANNESAYSYFEFVTKKQIGTLKIKTDHTVLALPIYDPNSGVSGQKVLRIQTPNGIGCLELVEVTHNAASPIRVKTSSGIVSVSKEY